jgi:hypothetical protein
VQHESDEWGALRSRSFRVSDLMKNNLLQRRRSSFDPSTWIRQPVSDTCDLQYVKGPLVRIDRWWVTIRCMVEVLYDFAVLSPSLPCRTLCSPYSVWLFWFKRFGECLDTRLYLYFLSSSAFSCIDLMFASHLGSALLMFCLWYVLAQMLGT